MGGIHTASNVFNEADSACLPPVWLNLDDCRGPESIDWRAVREWGCPSSTRLAIRFTVESEGHPQLCRNQ